MKKVKKVRTKCPHCNQTQDYKPNDGKIWNKKKKCVYCGKIFTIYNETNRNYVKIFEGRD
ncbi:MAG: hypothetical protein ABEK17_00340 [Candidatus Aenigmatarchaeota archaeon]